MSLEVIDWLLEKNHNKIFTVSSFMVLFTRLEIVKISRNSFEVDKIADYYSCFSIVIWVLFIVLTILGYVCINNHKVWIGVVKDIITDVMVVIYVCTCLCDLVIYDGYLATDKSVLIMAVCYTLLFVKNRFSKIISDNINKFN